MDTELSYNETVKQTLTAYAMRYSKNNEVSLHTLFDDEQQRYLLLDVGWYGDEYVHHAPIHIDIIDDKIWVQYDDTEDGVATALLEAGVPKSGIVLGFRPLKVRPYTEFAVN